MPRAAAGLRGGPVAAHHEAQMRRSIVSAGRCVVSVEAGAWTVVAVVEDAGGAGSPAVIEAIVAEAVAATIASDAAPSGWPAQIAARISEPLTARRGGAPPWLLYAGLVIGGLTAHVCTAGDLRVHLLQDGRVLRASRDHVLANESPAWVRAHYGDSLLPAQGSVVSRSLGRSMLPPESVEWPLAGAWSIVVASSAIHGHRPPEAYAAALAEAPAECADGAAWVRIAGVDTAVAEAVARAAGDPAVLYAWAGGATLTPAQCRAVGEALAAMIDPYLEAYEGDDDEIEDRAEGWRRRAAALQIEGGAPWELEMRGRENLTGDGGTFFFLEATIVCLEEAESAGFTLLRPVEAALEWPAAAAREEALRLAEETLRRIRGIEEVAARVADAERALAQVRAAAEADREGACAASHEALQRVCRRLRRERDGAIADAEEEGTDPDANAEAYRLQIAVCVAEVVLAAIAASPDFRQIFGAVPFHSTGRVGLGYPMFALESCRERYYSLTDAGFDELFNGDSDDEAKVARRGIEALLRASLRAARG